MRAPIQIGPLRDQNQVRAAFQRVGHAHDILASRRLGFPATRDHRSRAHRIGIERDHPHRTAPQRRVALLHDGREKPVEIEVEPFDGRGFSHGSLSREESEQRNICGTHESRFYPVPCPSPPLAVAVKRFRDWAEAAISICENNVD